MDRIPSAELQKNTWGTRWSHTHNIVSDIISFFLSFIIIHSFIHSARPLLCLFLFSFSLSFCCLYIFKSASGGCFPSLIPSQMLSLLFISPVWYFLQSPYPDQLLLVWYPNVELIRIGFYLANCSPLRWSTGTGTCTKLSSTLPRSVRFGLFFSPLRPIVSSINTNVQLFFLDLSPLFLSSHLLQPKHSSPRSSGMILSSTIRLVALDDRMCDMCVVKTGCCCLFVRWTHCT